MRHFILSSLLLIFIAIIVAGAFVVMVIERSLPDVESLKTVKLQVPLRIYTKDGQLIAEYGEQRRLPVTLQEIPKPLINAVLATEDTRFYENRGIDVIGLVRAMIVLLTTGEKAQGASTITMQVARNFFLTREKTFTRKLREILLALKIGRDLDKDTVLSLYLNKIYFGARAYGVAAAAQIYYGKKLDQLTLAQIAMIAGLPQAPSSNNPLSNPKAAIERRYHVLQRMLELNYISRAEYEQAIEQPVTASLHKKLVDFYAPYVGEAVRDELVKRYGKAAYEDGFSVYTTVDGHLQQAANQALYNAVINYDHRHGYRKATENWGAMPSGEKKHWAKRLSSIPVINDLQPTVVLQVFEQDFTALLSSGQSITVGWDGMKWAKTGRSPNKAGDIVRIGDVIRVVKNKDKRWQLAQLPNVEGALLAINPENGAILAIVGGFSYQKSKFNRVRQAIRQPGSAFKPFIYSAALNKGYTLATLINDAPIVIPAQGGQQTWRPQNSTRKFYGPTRLRLGLEKSRNAMSVRLLSEIGISYTVNYLKRFGFEGKAMVPESLSLALGTAELTPLQLGAGFAIFANGGYKVKPYLIDHINDYEGQEIYKADPAIACTWGELFSASEAQTQGTVYPITTPAQADQKTTPSATEKTKHLALQVITPQNAYLMNSMLQGVIKEGTGRQARILKRDDLGGKTGTTQDQHDGWFVGFNTQIVTVAWLGFDQPRSLKEYAVQAALPMWIDFMQVALKNMPAKPLPRPTGITSVRINKTTGLRASAGDDNSHFELFRGNNTPREIHYNEDNNFDLTSDGEGIY